MSALGRKLRRLEGGFVTFRCPGCGETHMLRIDGDQRPRWSFNGDGDAPTFSPSILAQGVREDLTEAELAEMDAAYGDPPKLSVLEDPRFRTVCHSFVEAGRIRFLGDCTHALAGQTVDLPDLPSN